MTSRNPHARAVFVALVVLLNVFGYGADQSATAAAIYNRAAEIENLRTVDTPPYEFRADVQITASGGTTRGTYHFIWNGPKRWRQELILPEYRELRVADGEHYWRLRPAQIHFIQSKKVYSLLGLAGPKLHPETKIKKVGNREEHGMRITCVEFREFAGQTCFDSARGVRLSYESASGKMLYSDFHEFRDKLVPYKLADESRGVSVAAQITELKALAVPDPKLFIAPAGAEAWETCDDVQPPKALESPEPPYPERLRAARVQGKAKLQVTITKTGLPSDIFVFFADAPEFGTAAADAVAHWKFRPAMCGNNPVEEEVTVEMNFRM